MNRFSRRLSLLLCVLLLLITALSGCGTSPAAPSGPSTPQTPTAEDEALRRAPFQPVITCELAGEAETLTEEQQQAILSYTTMQQSGETVQVTLREILRVDHLRQGVIAATRTSVDHTLTLRQQVDGSWQVCGDSYEALGHTCAVTP